MTTEDFCALLDARGIRYTRDGEAIHVPSALDLSGCTSLTSLPERLSVDGYLYLNGCTSLTSLPETLSVPGSLDLSGCVFTQQWRGRRVTITSIDGLATVIGKFKTLPDGSEVTKARYFRTVAYEDMAPCYVARINGYTAHGDTVAKAIRDARFKFAEADFDADDLIATITERGTVEFNDFRLLTGACESGLREGMRQAGLDPDAQSLPLATVLANAYGEFGAAFKEHFR